MLFVFHQALRCVNRPINVNSFNCMIYEPAPSKGDHTNLKSYDRRSIFIPFIHISTKKTKSIFNIHGHISHTQCTHRIHHDDELKLNNHNSKFEMGKLPKYYAYLQSIAFNRIGLMQTIFDIDHKNPTHFVR